MKFHSKIDLFNIFIYLICVVGITLPLFLIGFSVWYLVLVLAVVVFISLAMFNTYYILGENEIKIHNGFVGFNLPYKIINKISKVKTFKLSSNTALKAIEIKYGYSNGKSLKFYISPAKEEEFLSLIKNKCENVSENIDKRSRVKGEKTLN